MRKLLQVAWNEFTFVLRQWIIYIPLLGVPLIVVAVGVAPRLNQTLQQSPLSEVETVLNPPQTLIVPTGYVDQANLIEDVPPEEADNFRPYPDEDAARQALAAGEISSYYVIPADYVQSGQLFHYSHEIQLIADTDQAVERLLTHNLLLVSVGQPLAARIERPMALVFNGPPPPRFEFLPPQLEMPRLVGALAVAGLFTYLLGMTGNLLIRALDREAQARVLELLVTSTTPTQLLAGKMLGLCALALLQAVIALLAGLLVFGAVPLDARQVQLEFPAVLLSIPYLLLGYFAYNGVLLGLVAVLPRFHEKTQLLTLLRWAALTPLLGLLFIVPAPEGTVALFLTLFPVTSPLLMPARLLLGAVPFWQQALSLALLAGWALFSAWLAIRLFRAQGLLTGNLPSRRLLRQALRG